MRITAVAPDLEQGYEALRAQAVGEIPSLTPRGLTLFLRGGMLAWMCACAPSRRSTPAQTTSARSHRGLASASAEVVSLLTEMALSSRRRCWA